MVRSPLGALKARETGRCWARWSKENHFWYSFPRKTGTITKLQSVNARTNSFEKSQIAQSIGRLQEIRKRIDAGTDESWRWMISSPQYECGTNWARRSAWWSRNRLAKEAADSLKKKMTSPNSLTVTSKIGEWTKTGPKEHEQCTGHSGPWMNVGDDTEWRWGMTTWWTCGPFQIRTIRGATGCGWDGYRQHYSTFHQKLKAVLRAAGIAISVDPAYKSAEFKGKVEDRLDIPDQSRAGEDGKGGL